MHKKTLDEGLVEPEVSPPEVRTAEELAEEGRKKRLANLTQSGRPKGVTRRPKDLTQKELSKAVQLLALGAGETAVQNQFGLSESGIRSIREQFKGIFQTLEEVDPYRKVKADLFDAVELRTLKSLVSEEKHEKASLNQCAYTLSVIHNAGRLEKNLSTSNVNVNSYLRFILPENSSENES
jgi:hypothetical protein